MKYLHVLTRDEKEARSKEGQTNNKAKQHSTPKAVTFPKKNELPRVGLHRKYMETYMFWALSREVLLFHEHSLKPADINFSNGI